MFSSDYNKRSHVSEKAAAWEEMFYSIGFLT